MKIAVYSIALNEEQFVQRWYESAQEADFLLIADTGSTDNTLEIAESLGIRTIRISIKPWRFDDARNASLAALPGDVDYCIALDMDEILLPDWRHALESVTPGITRPRYKYTWSWNSDGTPGLQYNGDKIHARHGYRWRHPVHEVLTAYGNVAETQEVIPLEIHHHPDNTKSRSQYKPLLQMAVIEDPHNDRNAFYYARELFFNGEIPQAATEFKRHLDLPSSRWGPERAASMRYLAKCEPDNAEYWLNRARETSPRREVFSDMAMHFYLQKDFVRCLESAESAIAISEKPLDYLCEADAWGAKPYDLAAVSAFYLGKMDLALKYGEIAAQLAPWDSRLVANLEEYRKANE